ncbi:MAG: hypothetical protein KGZ59_05225 [Chitinophagaceae bacterium]|nr:hypothetical protein [Chitinophagaceae bacterium]MBS4043198.1 hypothetical protein [Chitinophagaceae bacterium]
MNPNFLQTICQYVVAIGIILTAIGGLGSYYYGKKADELKNATLTPITQNKINVVSPLNSPTIGKVENQTINYNNLNSKQLKSELKKENSENEKDNHKVNVTSYNQQGGITANQVNIGSQPRILNLEVQNQLLQILESKKGQKITIVSIMGDGEAFSFATQIKNYLIEQGHIISGVDQSVYTEPVMGQIFNPERLEIIIGTKNN